MRTLIIGLDGATFTILDPLLKQGKLENISNIVENGCSLPLQSTIPPVTAPAWTSMLTGFNPGRHGVYDFLQKEQGKYNYRPITSSQVKKDTFFEILSRKGFSVCSINVPNTFPPSKVNGVIVSGMLTPDTNSNFTHPRRFAKQLRKLNYSITPSTSHKKQEKYKKELFKCMEDRLKAFNTAKKEHGKFDLAMIVFGATDHVGHYFWNSDSIHKIIEDTYRKADELIGGLIEENPEFENIFIVSDHGMTYAKKSFFVNNYLMKENFLKLKNDVSTRLRKVATDLGVTKSNVFKVIDSLNLTNRLKKGILVKGGGKTKKSLINKLFLSMDDVNWKKTQAFAFGTLGQVFVNLKGRDPQGFVEPDNYERVREDIANALLDVRDPEDGEKIIKHVYKREDVYHGEYLENAPDLVFTPKEYKYRLSRFFDFGSSKITSPTVRGMNGNHERTGIFLSNKPLKKDLEQASIEDVAATVISRYGLTFQDMEGNTIPIEN